MKRLLRSAFICLLVLHVAVAPVLAAESTNPYSYDHDEKDYILPAVGLVALIGGITWYVVKKTRKSKKNKQADVQTALTPKKKVKMNLLLDRAPIKRSLASTDVDMDYRIGMSLRF